MGGETRGDLTSVSFLFSSLSFSLVRWSGPNASVLVGLIHFYEVQNKVENPEILGVCETRVDWWKIEYPVRE